MHLNVWRGFVDAGELWTELGKATGRKDVAAHGAELLAAAPQLLAALQASLKLDPRDGQPEGAALRADGRRPAEQAGDPPVGALGDFRGIPELMYSGALSYQQTEDLWTYFTYANDTRMVTRPTTLAAPGTTISARPTRRTGWRTASWSTTWSSASVHYFGFGSAHAYARHGDDAEASHPDATSARPTTSPRA